MSWDLHIGWLVLGGFALIAMTALPRLFHARPLSIPILYIGVGWAVFELSDSLIGPRPLSGSLDSKVIEYVTEFVVIISLVGAGLRVERRPGWYRWNSVWRLLGITMVMSVAAVALLGTWVLGLAVAPAVLLAGVLAPTDPVLADDVQVAAPGERKERDEVRFTLTTEAGLNDALAFPFVHLAIAATTATLGASLLEWVAYDVGYRIAVGAVSGWLLGSTINRFGRHSGEFFRNETSEGLFSLGATILVYGLTEIVNGYGFLAVFVAALVRGGADNDYRRKAHDFIGQIESIVLALTLLAFGALISEGILGALTWQGAAVGLGLVLVIRPVAGWMGLLRRPMPARDRVAIAFFGIRGMGSLYYLAYAANHADFGDEALAEVWAIVSFVVLVSVGVHGVTASPLMHRLDARRDNADANSDTVNDPDGLNDPNNQEEIAHE
jgi:NhaP-type Na+/H+ or K+/H+ antiporter